MKKNQRTNTALGKKSERNKERVLYIVSKEYKFSMKN